MVFESSNPASQQLAGTLVTRIPPDHDTIFADRREAFYRFAHFTPLGYLPEDATAEYISSRFKKLGFDFMPESVQMIIQYTHCHPYYVQLLCQSTFLRCLEKRRIRPSDVRLAYQDALISEKTYFEELWQNLKSRKNFLGILTLLSQGKDPYQFRRLEKQAIYYILSQLEERGFIKKPAGEHYRVIDPLFSDFIRMRFAE